METKETLLNWLNALEPRSFIGIDQGGLTLCAVKRNELTGETFELGGIPEEIETGGRK